MNAITQFTEKKLPSLFDAIIHLQSYPKPPVSFPNYDSGDYSYLIDPDGWIILHPKLWDMKGYDNRTQQLVPAWNNNGPQEFPIQYTDDSANRVGFDVKEALQPNDLNKPIVRSFKNVNGLVRTRILLPIPFAHGDYKDSGYFAILVHGLDNAEFYSRIEEFQGKVTGAILQSKRLALVVIVFLLACIGSAILYSYKRIPLPIVRLTTSVEKLQRDAEGDLLVPCTNDPSEVERLTIAINNMISTIRDQAGLAAIGKLSTQVAHDIRSPLSSMQAALMMLQKHCGSDKDAKEFLNLLQLSSNRLNDIANGLLAKYKGEESVSQTFSIHEVLDELIGELQASPLGQGTEFKKQYSNTALYVSGDKSGINRAIGNIIKNALEAMQSCAVKQLTVSTSCHPSLREGSQNDKVSIRITDTGPGISEDKIPLILQGGHSEGKADGHGIGTKVVKEVVEAHQGQLDIESEVGVGTTFIITLPATLHHDEMTVMIPYAVGSAVAVIDDEPSLREQWRLTLKAQGVQARIFSCWEEYDSSATPQNDKSGTFIIDYHFDNSLVDGLEIIRKLKQAGYSQFILATAEYWKPDIKAAAQSLGAALCPKPLPRVVVQTCHPEPFAACHPEAQPKDLKEVSSVAALPQNDNSGRTVLLIDDDDAIRLTWSAIRKQLGVATLHCFPSLEAVIQAKVNLGDCDLCIIDKNIPGSNYDGARMLDYLKQNGAKKVILATGEQERDIRKDPQFDALDGITAEKIPMSLERYWN